MQLKTHLAVRQRNAKDSSFDTGRNNFNDLIYQIICYYTLDTF